MPAPPGRANKALLVVREPENEELNGTRVA